jgi:hypothetical protein
MPSEMRLERAGVLLGRASGKRADGLGCDPAARGENGIEMNKRTKLWLSFMSRREVKYDNTIN